MKNFGADTAAVKSQNDEGGYNDDDWSECEWRDDDDDDIMSSPTNYVESKRASPVLSLAKEEPMQECEETPNGLQEFCQSWSKWCETHTKQEIAEATSFMLKQSQGINEKQQEIEKQDETTFGGIQEGDVSAYFTRRMNKVLQNTIEQGPTKMDVEPSKQDEAMQEKEESAVPAGVKEGDFRAYFTRRLSKLVEATPPTKVLVPGSKVFDLEINPSILQDPTDGKIDFNLDFPASRVALDPKESSSSKRKGALLQPGSHVLDVEEADSDDTALYISSFRSIQDGTLSTAKPAQRHRLKFKQKPPPPLQDDAVLATLENQDLSGQETKRRRFSISTAPSKGTREERDAERETRKTQDGCLLPKSTLKKTSNGTYARPRGRCPPDMVWDSRRGVFAPPTKRNKAKPKKAEQSSTKSSSAVVPKKSPKASTTQSSSPCAKEASPSRSVVALPPKSNFVNRASSGELATASAAATSPQEVSNPSPVVASTETKDGSRASGEQVVAKAVVAPRVKWSESEDNLLREKLAIRPALSLQEITTVFPGRTIGGVSGRASKLGLINRFAKRKVQRTGASKNQSGASRGENVTTKAAATSQKPPFRHTLLGNACMPYDNEETSTTQPPPHPQTCPDTQTDGVLSAVEMEFAWLWEESIHCLEGDDICWSFIYEHASHALQVELLKGTDLVRPEVEEATLLRRESIRGSLLRGYRRKSMGKTIALHRLALQRGITIEMLRKRMARNQKKMPPSKAMPLKKRVNHTPTGSDDRMQSGVVNVAYQHSAGSRSNVLNDIEEELAWLLEESIMQNIFEGIDYKYILANASPTLRAAMDRHSRRWLPRLVRLHSEEVKNEFELRRLQNQHQLYNGYRRPETKAVLPAGKMTISQYREQQSHRAET